jgi:hypothetical protein
MNRLQRLLTFEFYAERFDGFLLGLFIIGVALLFLSALVGKGRDIIAEGDPALQFEYARSIMADGRFPADPIRFPCGVAMIGLAGYAPAFAVAKGLLAAGVLRPSERLLSGWSLPLQFAYCLPLLVLSFFGFRANLSMLSRLGYGDVVSKATILFWIVTTNIGFYVLKEPARSEGVTYALLSFYYWALIRWYFVTPRERDDAKPPVTAKVAFQRALFLGVVLGLAGTVRQQNILHSLSLPLLLLTQRGAALGSERRAAFRQSLLTIVVTAAVSGILFVIPWIPWSYAFGQFRFMSYTEGHFNWLSPRPWLVLFVPGYHGLFVYHPAFLLAAVGLLMFLRRQRDLRVTWLVAIGAQLYLISTWYWLAYGASIGHRGFFTLFPLLLTGFVAFATWVRERGHAMLFCGGMWALTATNAVVTLLILLRVLDPTWGYPANSGF